MMANYHIFVMGFSILVFNNVYFVQCVDQCKTHEDCKEYVISSPKYCCGGYIYSFNQDKQRRCRYGSCLNHYCSTDSDCDDSKMCCRSNRCVNKGCSGCSNSTDCYSRHVCCKRTFPLDQTVCAVNCLNKTCNFNDDCAGFGECCRSGRCTSAGCYYNKCTSNSECNQGQYCCKKKTGYYYRDGCSKSCVGEICSTSEDCGGPNECCISNKCVDRGCSGCTTNSNCSTGQYCCKKRQWYELSECSAHCVGKSCNANDDCGGPDETCDSYLCGKLSVKESEDSFPPWVIAVITVSLVVFLVAVGIFLVVFFHMRRKRRANTTQAGTVSPDNTQYQAGAEVLNQPIAQSYYLNNPTYQPGQTSNVALQPHSYYPKRFKNGAHDSSSQTPVLQSQNQATLLQQDNQEYQSVMSSEPTQLNNGVNHYHNEMHDPVYHTLESQGAPEDTHNGSQQAYSLNVPYQSNNYPHNPPYNPQFEAGYQGKH